MHVMNTILQKTNFKIFHYATCYKIIKIPYICTMKIFVKILDNKNKY